jgi:dTDP-4-dehydrorhamnose reductase
MLGSAVLEVFKDAPEIGLRVTSREGVLGMAPPGIEVATLDASAGSRSDLIRVLDDCDWAVNCIGLIKHRIQDHQRDSTERAVRVNALFPHILANAAQETGCSVLQIATDCVYSGAKGSYIESDPHDAIDVYGKSKSLGEVCAPGMHHLRCSIIGRELKDHRSLLDWFLGHPQGARIQGFSNHLWNGVTTLHFARICLGVIREGIVLPHLCHVVPEDVLPKGDLLKVFRQAFGREDLQVDLHPAPQAVDRSLATSDTALNHRLWASAGYSAPPTLAGMVTELAERTHSGKRWHA